MFQRTCKGCGNEFETANAKQSRCRKDCGRASRNLARATRRLSNDISFVGVDGEGVDRPDGAHEYVMLSVGNRTLWRDGAQLPLRDILSFLYECYTDQPDAAYVGFFLGYDFIQWEKLLPEREARLLLTSDGIASRKSKRKSRANPFPDAVVWEGWEIDIMAGRRFKLRPHIHHRSEYSGSCRNRTCLFDMGNVSYGDVVQDEIGTLVDGESRWSIPDTNGVEYNGNIAAFWDRFTVPIRSVGQGAVKGKAYGWMYICDTGPFWQTSFLNVINPKSWDGRPVCTDDEYQTVVTGKADRGMVCDYGTTDYYDDMVKYNTLENDILARVTARLNEGFMNDRIPIKIPKTDWYGPGRAAQLWIDQLHALCADSGIVEYNKYVARNNGKNSNIRLERKNETGLLNADVYMSMPTWFYDAAQGSYYGGWFEQFMHGHIGDVWEYDINSAYPFIIASLPCLHATNGHNGEYTREKDPNNIPADGYTLCYGTVRGSNPYIGAMPYRSQQGLISRPHVTKGWYWKHEIDAARDAGLIDSVDIEEWVSYRACDCSPPFDPPSIGISRLYQARLDFGKNTPQGKSAKLVYNSAYGKTAQSIGTPKYSNPVYASLITAGCRTLILEAISTHPEKAKAVSMVATDGVYFTSCHPGLHLSTTQLGAWDETFKVGMTQLMPGVYWDNNTREALKLGKNPKLKSRGVNARDLAREIENLDHLFALSHQALAQGKEYIWPEIVFSVDFLLDSAKSALQRGKWETAGRVTHGTQRRISSNPRTKRNPLAYRDNAAGGITRTSPWTSFTEVDTTPYRQSFGYVENDPMGTLFGDSIGRDGDDGMQYWRDLISGH